MGKDSKKEILERCRRNALTSVERPDLSDISPLTFEDPLQSFIYTCGIMASKVVEGVKRSEVDAKIRELFPEAKEIASNLREVSIATRNPDTIAEARDLDGTDVGVISGVFGVAENGCIWIPQTMKEKAVCFISENLVVLLPKSEIVSNMHEAYGRIAFNDYGYGVFISGPSKTADIAQVLVTGAQAARTLTVFLMDD